jgi:hypothetical protein
VEQDSHQNDQRPWDHREKTSCQANKQKADRDEPRACGTDFIPAFPSADRFPRHWPSVNREALECNYGHCQSKFVYFAKTSEPDFAGIDFPEFLPVDLSGPLAAPSI